LFKLTGGAAGKDHGIGLGKPLRQMESAILDEEYKTALVCKKPNQFTDPESG